MCEQLKTLSPNQLEHLLREAVDGYLGEEYDYTIKDLNSPNVNSTEQKLTFGVEIRCRNMSSH